MLKRSLILASAALVAGVTAFAAEEIRIGALVPEKGALESEGKTVRTALTIAEKHINEGFDVQGEYKLAVTCEGTDPDTPSIALDKLKVLKEKGINIVVGPTTDAEIAAVKDFADKEKILLISYGCTSMDYAIANDNIFRILPDDSSTSFALSSEIVANKIASVIIVKKGDAFGNAFFSALKASLEKAKITISDEMTFAADHKDLASVLSGLDSKIADAVKKYGEGKVAVVLVAASGMLGQGASCTACCETSAVKCENLDILQQASKIQGLGKARWYLASAPNDKCDGAVKKDKVLADFCVKTQLVFPVTAINETDAYADLSAALKKASPGGDVSIYPFAAYDALILAVDVSRNALAKGRTDFTELKEDMCARSRFSHGLTGFNTLNDKGDRVADDVNFLRLKAVNGSYEWIPVSRYFCKGGSCIPLDDAKPEAPKGTPLMENKMFPVK